MKTLIINGSPKGDNSNSLVLTKAFIEGAEISEYEIIDTYKLDMNSCVGCFSCWKNTPGVCIYQDDMSDLLDKIINADLIIWSFPLYYYNVPSNMKRVIDRMLPMNLPFMDSGVDSGAHPARYDLSVQRHVVISTCGFWTSDGNYDSVNSMFDHIYGKDNYLKIYCGQGELFSYSELNGVLNPYLEIVKQAGKQFINGSVSDEISTKLSQPLLEREVFEKLADASWGIDEKTNEKIDESLVFTKQMMGLYKGDGVRRVLEFRYTDINKRYQAILDVGDTKVIDKDFVEATTIIKTPYSVWRKIANGEISGQNALFEKMYQVEGDFDLMLNWDKLFRGNSGSGAVSVDTKGLRSNMLLLLMPWIMFWTLIPINNMLGAYITIICATLIPLFYSKYKAVIYEKLSIPILVGMSILVINGYDTSLIIVCSYIIFGLMWILSCVTKMSLTAYYSSKDYGDDTAYLNPLFMHTNKILTMGWGILYIVTSIIAYIFKDMWFVSFISMGAPILMGIFTAWFQRWYPKHYAQVK